MAVKSNSSWRQTSLLALAVAALSLPTAAQADPDRTRNWRERVERSEDSPRAQRPEPVQARPQQAQPQQAQPRQSRSWSPPRQAQGRVHAAPEARWNRGLERPERARSEAEPATARTWSDRVDRNHSATTERRERTTRPWRDRQRDAAVASGTVAPAVAPARSWNDRATASPVSRSGDWRSRVQRSEADRQRDDRQRRYWRERNWSNHWDHSRRYRWSGWNNHWDWAWGSPYTSWNTRWRSNSRYDWYGWRNRYPSYFQVGFYTAPYRGYGYRPLSIGSILDALFFGEDYWIADPWYYRLPEVYGPYRWVRYYDDAVLVNIYTGEVADLIRNFFW